MSDSHKWVKLFTDWWHHPKRKALRPRDKRGRIKPCCAACLHVDALAYCGAPYNGGVIDRDAALDTLYGTDAFIAQLVDAGLWDPSPVLPDVWIIHDYDKVQAVPAEVSAQRSQAGRKGNCKRHQHPPGCECWKDEGAVA